MPRLHEEKRYLVEQLVEQGLTKKQIAEKSGIPFGSIAHYLNRWKLKTVRHRGQATVGQDMIREISAGTGLPSNTVGKIIAISDGKENVYETVRSMMLDGSKLFDIADRVNVPRGSIGYFVDRWGLKGLQKLNRGGNLTKSGKELSSQKISLSHKRGRKHPFKGLVSLRGNWVEESVFLVELQKCLDEDMTYAQMENELGVTSGPIWKMMKRHGLLKGMRSGERDPKFRGGHRKYRGPDWYKNRKLALERDGYICVDCGQTQEQEKAQRRNRSLSVHHRIPYEISQDSSLSNLITLCQHCHMVREHRDGRLGQRFKKQ